MTEATEGAARGATGGSAEEDLALIRRLMEQSRGTVEAAGPHFVIWGVLITLALVGSYANAVGAVELDELWLWTGTVGIGWLASLFVGTRTARRSAVRGVGGRIMAAIWIGTGIALTLLGFVGAPVQAFTEAGALLGAMSACIGAACFASAAVQSSSGFRVLAAGWWLGAAAMFVWEGLVAVLLMAGLMVALHLVPGVWLILRSRQEGEARGDRAAGETA